VQGVLHDPDQALSNQKFVDLSRRLARPAGLLTGDTAINGEHQW
jgi:superfamily II RNA helicase